MDLVNWAVKYGNDLTLITFLLIAVVVIGVGAYRGWWVPGPTHRALQKKFDDLEKETKEEAKRIRLRLEFFEEQERQRFQRSGEGHD